MNSTRWCAYCKHLCIGLLLITAAGTVASGCNNQRTSLDGKTKEEQVKAMKGGPIPPEVAAKMAEARAKGASVGAEASRKAQAK